MKRLRKNTYVACECGRGYALLDRGLGFGRTWVGVVPAAIVSGDDQFEGVGVGDDGEDVVDGDCVDGEIHHFVCFGLSKADGELRLVMVYFVWNIRNGDADGKFFDI